MVSAHMVWTPQGLGTRRPFWLSGRATHVPLLNFLKMSVQLAPSRARRLATTLRTHSSTQPSGRTYFHRAGFLLPMVVSSVTWRMAGDAARGPGEGCQAETLLGSHAPPPRDHSLVIQQSFTKLGSGAGFRLRYLFLPGTQRETRRNPVPSSAPTAASKGTQSATPTALSSH